jgi:hypothetical protein
MRLTWAVVLILVMAPAASAYSPTGICFLDAILNWLDTISQKASNAVNPTTTTTTESTTTTTEETTTSTTVEEETTTSSSTTTTEQPTTTTAFKGACMQTSDCPTAKTDYLCDQDSHILQMTTNFFCSNPGPASECKGQMTKPRIIQTCDNTEKCEKGKDHCVARD